MPTILLPGFLGTGPPLPQELVAWEKAQQGENEEVIPSSPLLQSAPVKQWLLPTVEGILQVPHQVGLARHAEEPFLSEPTLSDEVHTLLHQQGGQAGAIFSLLVNRVLQVLPKDPWVQRGPGHTLSYPVQQWGCVLGTMGGQRCY